MGTHRSRRLDRIAAEQLLARDPAVTGSLADVLAAAAPPAHPGPLAGEEAAVAALRMVRYDEGDRSSWRAARQSTTTKLVTTRVAVVGLVLATGGVAFAASTGVLPSPVTGDSGAPRRHVQTSPVQTTGGPTSAPAPRPSHGHTAVATEPSRAPSASTPAPPPASAAAALGGLCHSYIAKINAGKAPDLDKPKYAPLVAAAGGISEVPAYCATLLPTEPGDHATAPGNAGGHAGKSKKTPPGHLKSGAAAHRAGKSKTDSDATLGRE